MRFGEPRHRWLRTETGLNPFPLRLRAWRGLSLFALICHKLSNNHAFVVVVRHDVEYSNVYYEIAV
jgi:hypothetical protein